MNPQRALKKLQQARSHIEKFSLATSGKEFAECFSAFLAAIRSVPDALRKDLRGQKKWRPWFDAREKEMRADPLISFLFDLRNRDLHEGEHRLVFSTHVAHMRIRNRPGAAFVLGADGPYWVYDQGQPSERREPVREGLYSTSVGIANPPTLHRGRPIIDDSPVGLCRLAVRYFEGLLGEAMKKFN